MFVGQKRQEEEKNILDEKIMVLEPLRQEKGLARLTIDFRISCLDQLMKLNYIIFCFQFPSVTCEMTCTYVTREGLT